MEYKKLRVFLEKQKTKLFIKPVFFVISCLALLLILGNHNFASAEDYIIEITGASETTLSGLPGELVTGTNDLAITSTCPAGYSVYISGTNSAENNDDYNLYLNGDNTEDSYLVNSNGTIEAATTLSENTWGVLADEGVYYGISNNLVSVYNYDGAEENKLLPMTYGANLGASLEAGTYKMASEGGVLYTLLADDTCYNRTLTYDINNGDGGSVPEPQSVPYGQTALVATGTQTKTNHGFLGWSEDQSATEPTYIAGDSITMEEDKILYAVWDENYVVTYNSEDGTGATNTVTYQRSCARQSVQNVIQTNDSVTQLLNRSENTLVSMTGNVASATGGAINTISSNYNDNMLEFDVMQFPGATEVRVLLLYDIGEATYDLNTLSGDGVMVYAGAATNVQTILGDSGNIKTAHTNQTNLYEDSADGAEVLQITGNTVTIAIQSDGSESGAGYLALAIGIDENGNPVPGSHISSVSEPTSEIVCAATAVDGTYTAPSRTGHTFSGWTKNSSASRGEYASEGVVKSELGKTITDNPEELYAIWTAARVSYELTLDAVFDEIPTYSGDSPYSHCETTYGGTCTINLPSETLSYDDWAFLGWSTSESSTTADYMPGDSVELSGDLTLYAAWEKQIALDYSTEYGETPASEFCTIYPSEESCEFTVASIEDVEGYTFNSWMGSDGMTYYPGDTITTSTNFMLTADWTEDQPDIYTNNIIYDVNGGDEATAPGSTACNTTEPGGCMVPVTDDIPTRTDYVFDGWSTDPDADVTTYADEGIKYNPGEEINVEGDLPLYAIWRDYYIVTYETNNPDNFETFDEHSNAISGGSATIVVNAYDNSSEQTFVGWTDDPAAETADTSTYPLGEEITISSDLTLYGIWTSESEIYTYSIIYEVNGGDEATAPGSTACNTTEPGGCMIPVTDDVPSRTDYVFDGWSTDPNADVTTYADEGIKYSPGEEIDSDEDITLYAIWRNYYIITYETNDPETPDTYVNYSDPISGGSATIMIDTCGGTEENIFEGWTDDPAAETADTATYPLGEEITISSDITLYGVWTYQPITEYNYRVIVTYNMDGGTGGPEGWTEEGTTRDNYIMNTYCPETTGYEEKEGYEFMGWLDESGNMVTGCDGMSQLELSDDTNMNEFTFEYTATWGAPYTVTFDANGGTGAPEPMQTAAAIPGDYVEFMISDTASGMEKENTNFLGWDTDPNAATPGYKDGSTIYINEDTILYAVWGDADLNLIYDANGGGGAPMQQTKTASNGVVTFTVSDQAPYYQGKDFLGWNTDRNATEPTYLAGDMITIRKDTWLYAVWADPIQIVYHGDFNSDGDDSDTNAVTYDKTCSKVTHSDIVVDPDGESESTTLRSLTSNLARAVAFNNPDYITSDYNNNIQELDIMHFPGATNINVQVVYDLTGAFDLSTGTGDALIIHPGSPSSVEDIVAGYAAGTTTIISDASNLANYINTGTMAQYNISGEYVTLAMYTDDTDTALGYYAIITATDANSNEVFGTHTVTPSSTSEIVCNYSATYGTYALPTKDYADFLGWNTNEFASSGTYADEQAIIAALGDTITTSPYDVYAIWDETYTVHYDGNGASGGDMSDVTTQSVRVAEGSTMMLSSPRFYRDGYGLAGWSTDPNAVPGGTSKIYGPNEWIMVEGDFVAADTDHDRNVTLYAIWVQVSDSMQGFDPNRSTYASAPTGSVVAMLDVRDNNVYTVAKLDDGNWWMAENLRLDPNNLVNNTVISASNTNNPTSEFITKLESWPTTSYNKCNNYTDACVDSLSIGVDNIDKSNNAKYWDGALYNWYTVTAGNGLNNMGRDATAAGDICPAGWHLPKGTTNGDFVTLSTSIGGLATNMDYNTTPTGHEISNKLHSFPYNHSDVDVLDGPYTSGNYNEYWTSTAYSTLVASTMATSYEEARVSSAINKSNGAPARCMMTVPKYNITYDGNGADFGDMSSVSHTNIKAGDSIYLRVPNYLKSYYGFAGWSTDPNATPGGTSKIYGPEESLVVDSNFLAADTDHDRNIKLYAVWVEVEGTTSLQDFDPTESKYASMPVGSVIALVDNRDTESYSVAKLADGNWWMTENLRFDPNASLAGSLGADMTNNPTSDFVTAVSNWTTTSFNSCHYLNDECMNSLSIGNWHIDKNSTAVASPYDLNQWFGYGAFYNWYTATAGHGLRSSAQDVTASGDICPAGWRLPAEESTGGDFTNLVVSLGGTSTKMDYDTTPSGKEISNTLRSFPNNFVIAGRYDGGNGLVNEGTYWSSTALSTPAATTLLFHYEEVNPSGAEIKYTGMPIRCMKQ